MSGPEVSIPGLSRIADSSAARPRRLIWIIIIIAGITVSSYYIILRCIHYSNTPINIRVDTKRMKQLPLPVITICNYNFPMLSKVIPEPGLLQLVEKMLIFPAERNKTDPDFDQFNLTRFGQEYWLDFYSFYTAELDDMLIQVIIFSLFLPVF